MGDLDFAYTTRYPQQRIQAQLRGYNEDEIDDFLDQVVNDYEKLFRENDNLKEELSRMKKDNAQYQKLENNLKETLLIAQKTANEVTDTAKQHAENLRESTAKECQNMRRDAEISRADGRAADHQVKSATVEYCRLVEAKSQFLYQIKAALESELAVLHDAIDRLPRQQSAEPQQETKAEAAAAQDAAPQQGAAAADGAVQKG